MKIRTFLVAGILACSFGSCSNTENGNETQEAIAEIAIESITGVARIEPENGLLSIYANANGRIAQIVALENQQIAVNNPLLVLGNAVEKALLNVEQSKISAQNSAIEAAVRNAESVKSDLDKAKNDLVLNQQIYAVKGITEQALNDSKVNVEKLTNDYAKAIADKNRQASMVNEIKANIDYRHALLNERTLNSAFAGHVLQWEVHNGDYVIQGQKIGQFAPEGSLVAVTEIDELFQDRIKIGMVAEIYSQINGERIGSGTVVYIADFLKKKSLFSDENAVEDRRVKEVRVRLEGDSEAVINSKVDCVIHLK